MKELIKDAIVYQIYPKSFQDSNGDGIGDLQGIIKRLDYFNYLGINVIWLCPIYKSGGVDGGYDIADYKNIEKQFGTLEDFEELLKQAHKREIRVIMDLVVNHTSDKHNYFIESKSSKTNDKSDWYIWRDPKEDGGEPSPITSVFSGSAWQYDETRKQYYLHMFAKGQPDLNWDNPKVRDDVYSMMSWWMDKGIDGFRMDVISLISKSKSFLENGGTIIDNANGPNMNKYLKEMHQKVLSKYNVMTVGEAPDISVDQAKKMVNEEEKELDMIFNFDHITLEDNEYGKWNLNRYSMPEFREVLVKWQKGLKKSGFNSLFIGNHDQPRVVSRFGNDTSKLFWEKSAKMLATSLYCLKGTPYIFQGDEIGMTNTQIDSIEQSQDVEAINAYKELVDERGVYSPETMMDCIRSKGRDNSRTPVQWDDNINAGFSETKPWTQLNPNYKEINIEQQILDENSILQYYRKLIALRKNESVLRDGKFDILLEDDTNIFAYSRTIDSQKAIIVCNYSDKGSSLEKKFIKKLKKLDLILSNYNENNSSILKAYESRIYM